MSPTTPPSGAGVLISNGGFREPGSTTHSRQPVSRSRVQGCSPVAWVSAWTRPECQHSWSLDPRSLTGELRRDLCGSWGCWLRRCRRSVLVQAYRSRFVRRTRQVGGSPQICAQSQEREVVIPKEMPSSPCRRMTRDPTPSPALTTALLVDTSRYTRYTSMPVVNDASVRLYSHPAQLSRKYIPRMCCLLRPRECLCRLEHASASSCAKEYRVGGGGALGHTQLSPHRDTFVHYAGSAAAGKTKGPTTIRSSLTR